jgi:endonuclease I
VAAQKKTNIIFTYCGRFCREVCGKENEEHLRNALLHSYELTTDWGGTVYSGMNLKWDYHKIICDISMQGYVANVLSNFQHDNPKHPQHTPSRYVMPVYGANIQCATRDETPPLSEKTMHQHPKYHRLSIILLKGGRSHSEYAFE